MNRFAALFISALFFLGSVAAQEEITRGKTQSFTFTQDERVPSPGMNFYFQNDQGRQAKMAFYMTEMTAASGDVVTNAPYTATAVEESTQVLADGNRIVNKSSEFVARDSQGRTRRETTLSRIGPLQVDSPKMYFINDPTTHTQYVLAEGGEGTKIIRKENGSGPEIINLRGRENGGPEIIERRGKEATAQARVFFSTREGAAGKGEWKEAKHEDLGTQVIEGVSAQGRRETVTIPAGQIGNERPLEIVTEVWTSPDLHTVVLRKHSDPRVGETVFRLTDIKRGEPDASLFQPPQGAKIKTERVIELKQEPVKPKE